MQEPEILQLLLPALRADLEMDWTYRHEPGRLLDCPIIAVGGDRDETVSVEQVTAWKRHTTGPSCTEVFPGDHFFLHGAESALATLLLRGLSGLARGSSWNAAAEARELR
jgi:surfactin synthase thioesterase subunit